MIPPGPWHIGKPAGRRGYNLYDAEGCDVTNPDAQLDPQSAAMLQGMERGLTALREAAEASIAAINECNRNHGGHGTRAGAVPM